MDSKTSSTSSSPVSVPRSDDGIDSKVEVRRALDYVKIGKDRKDTKVTSETTTEVDEFYANARSGDTPPPPERKSGGFRRAASTGIGNDVQVKSSGQKIAKRGSLELKPTAPMRFQFYVPTPTNIDKEENSSDTIHPPDFDAWGSNRSGFSSGERSSEGKVLTTGGHHPPDPPEIERSGKLRVPRGAKGRSFPSTVNSAEESAQKVRSRLIQLQNRDRDGDTSNVLASNSHTVKSESRRNVGVDIDDSVDKRKKTGSNSGGGGSESPSPSKHTHGSMSERSIDIGDDEVDADNDDDFPLGNMEPIVSDDEDNGDEDNGPLQFGSSVPNFNFPSRQRSDNYYDDANVCPSSAPQRPPNRQMPPHLVQHLQQQLQKGPGRGGLGPPLTGGGLQFSNKQHSHQQHPHHYNVHQHQPQNPNQPRRPNRHSLPAGGPAFEGGLRSSAPNFALGNSSSGSSQTLFSDGINLLEKAAKEAHEQEEVDTLNDSINYLRNLQSGASKGEKKQLLPPPSPGIPNSNIGMQQTRRPAPPPPPPPFARPNRPPPRTSINEGGVENGPRNSSVAASHAAGGEQIGFQVRNHRPPPPPRQLGHHSTPNQNRKSRPPLTAAEAMDLVMNASARQMIGNEDGRNQNEDFASEQAFGAHESSSVSDPMLENGGHSGSEDSSDRNDSFDGSKVDETDDDEDDFDRKTSLSMHAEAKFGSVPGSAPFSKHAEDKRGMVDQQFGISKSADLDSLDDEDLTGSKMDNSVSSIPSNANPRSNSNIVAGMRSQLDRLTLNDLPSPFSDHSMSDSRLLREGRPRMRSLDPPDVNDDLGIRRNYSEVISPSVVPMRTVNEDLIAVETVIQGQYEESDHVNTGPRTFDYNLTPPQQLHNLGPRSKRPGCFTGIDLGMSHVNSRYRPTLAEEGRAKLDSSTSDDDASASQSVGDSNVINARYRPSLAEKGRLRLDSSSPDDDAIVNQRSQEEMLDTLSEDIGESISQSVLDKYSGNVELMGEVDRQSTSLMAKLCGHLLPAGFEVFSRQEDELFCGISSFFNQSNNMAWDDNDPDEPGYVVHRLTKAQLNGVEQAFEKMVNSLKRLSEEGACKSTNNANFVRDLEDAEMILDQEEKRHEAESRGHCPDGDSAADSDESDGKAFYGSSSRGSSPAGHASLDDFDSQNGYESKHGEIKKRTSVPGFPGIYPPGKGKAGEMECFYLPVITKSQKTGFEPTKDLVLKPGVVFANNYLVQSELGSAAFSTAYRCLDLSSEEDEEGYQDEVCLKVIKNTKDYFDQSLDEIKILRLLKDTGKVQENNIVEMKSFFYHREHLVIVTELLRQNLYEFGKSILESRGPPYFTRNRLSHVTRQCLVAFKFIHGLGLMHCDVKPENILLSSYSRALIKVIDFGSSSFVSDRQSSYIQSRSYRAPEVILGLPYDGKIDMWSLGCVVAEMYTGEVTFQNDSEISMLSRIEAICGPFPHHMISKGRNTHRIFTESGLIYEKVSSDDVEDSESGSFEDDGGTAKEANSTLFNIYQPKMTTIAARLGFDADFMEHPKLNEDDEKRAMFIDFVSKLLTIDPDLRPTASEALSHPWILSSLELTEDDVRYPPE